jgi:molybdopterin synthase catalytic subunit
VDAGEPSVAVAASAAHRPAAFAACRYAIDQLKARAPIWKQTVYADGGTAWIDGGAAIVPEPLPQGP